MSDATADPEALSTNQLDLLQQRVRKLEESVEELRDTKGLENRIVKRLRSRRDQAEEPAEPSLPTVAPQGPAPLKPPWLLFDMLREFKNMIAMLFDVRFHIGWMTRLVVIVILGVIVTDDWWMFPVNIIPFGFGIKVVNLILGFILFKIVTWETRRYMAQRR